MQFSWFPAHEISNIFVCVSVAISVYFASFLVPGCISRNMIRCIRQDIVLRCVRGLTIWSHTHSTSSYI